ncbi:MAG: PAS domain S-box protein, partial [Campylobacterota bacterium]
MKECEELQSFQKTLQSQTVLIADEKNGGEYLAKRFSKEGLEVSSVTSFEDLEQSCRDTCFDIAIINIHFDNIDRQQLFDLLLQNSYIKVFVIVNKKDSALRKELFQYPIVDYYDDGLPLSQIYNDMIQELVKIERNRSFDILIVENSQKICKQLEKILLPRGFKLQFAASGKAMLDTLQNRASDLVLLDTNLADMDVKTALKQLKNTSCADSPVIVISQSRDLELFSKVLKEGARDYIKKPFILEEVLIKIDMWVEMAYRKYQRDCQETLLNEYKDAIDVSTIVSKTDLKGKITYVNRAFCEISGYSAEELLGRSHNIVRHPDMPKYAFEDMWQTIQNQKIWRGIVKNRRKNGDYYVVETIIKPIIDKSGKTKEYIGIRTDITELENIKNNLQKRLNITNKSFKEVLNLSKEYEKALNESTIVSRTDLEGKIIYANEKFYEITGYNNEEVLGKTHRIVRHEENTDDFYAQMWQTVKRGEIWRGTIKNRKKDGSEYIVNTLIYPVKNSDNAVVEYMAIRNDITHIVKLHQEIEKTQREVIYKMGEVGESRSKETGEHVKRVAQYSYLLAKLAGLSQTEAMMLKNASPMHDIGKVGIADAILLKPAKLTEKEFETMKTHTQIGYSILKDSSRQLLQTAAIVAHEHHEKYDGSGYPRGLKGEQIHIYGRITAI